MYSLMKMGEIRLKTNSGNEDFFNIEKKRIVQKVESSKREEIWGYMCTYS